jgi:MFS family permease
MRWQEVKRLNKSLTSVFRPSGTSRYVVPLSFLLGSILYLDRAALSILAPSIQQELHLSPLAMGWVFSSFVFGYALFHVPVGWLGDRFGARKTLAATSLAWSLATSSTALAWSFPSLVILRFFFGAGEAGATPNVSRALANWIPLAQRAKAQGLFFAGMSAGAALAPPVITLLLLRYGWRTCFIMLGASGLLWIIPWLAFYRDPSPHVLALKPTPHPLDWSRLLRSCNLWSILLMYFGYGYTGYIYLTWFPTYLIEVRHLSVSSVGLMASLPAALGFLTKPLGGWWSDRTVIRRGTRYGRSLVGVVAFGLGALGLTLGLLAQNSYASAILLASSDGATALAQGVCFAVCLDIGLSRAGTVSALMLTAGSLGSVASALTFGAFLQHNNSWSAPFALGAAANFVGALLWLRIDAQEQLL